MTIKKSRLWVSRPAIFFDDCSRMKNGITLWSWSVSRIGMIARIWARTGKNHNYAMSWAGVNNMGFSIMNRRWASQKHAD